MTRRITAPQSQLSRTRRPRTATTPSTAPGFLRRTGRWRGSSRFLRKHRTGLGGFVLAFLIALLTVVLLCHRLLPNRYGIGSLIESFLPWLGAPILLSGIAAVVLRRQLALIAAAGSVLAWVAMFASAVIPRSAPEAHPDLSVISHNVYAANPDPVSTAHTLLAAEVDVVALQELAGMASHQLHAELNKKYPYRTSVGTVAAWSKYPLKDSSPVDVGMGWVRALRTVIETPRGDVALYVVHLASIRISADGLASQRRDATLRALASAISSDPAQRLILAGDLNTATTDRSLVGLTGQLTEAQQAAGKGFGFTWPARLPAVRLDHILSRGLTVTDAEVLGRTGSDHRPVKASFSLHIP